MNIDWAVVVSPALDLLLACCLHPHYDAWITRHGLTLGAVGLRRYWVQAAQLFEEQAYAASWKQCYRESAAREIYARILLDSVPLSPEELQKAAEKSFEEVRQGGSHC
jgi:hypothetical protein